jgi:biopolymer transport protein ExbD
MRIRRPEEEEFRPELTPLVDVVFQLIIFFMVSTVFIDFTRQMNIVIPKSDTSIVQEQVKSHTIEVTLDEKIFLDGEETNLNELAEQLGSKMDIRSVLIRADKRIYYGLVMQVMEICEGAGIKDIRAAVD